MRIREELMGIYRGNATMDGNDDSKEGEQNVVSRWLPYNIREETK